MKNLYVTPFDIKTKKCVGLSTKLPVTDMVTAEKMLGGEPTLRTKNMSIYNQPNGQALCVSWIRFSL